jgi:NitT/TauT family transport system permease protein
MTSPRWTRLWGGVRVWEELPPSGRPAARPALIDFLLVLGVLGAVFGLRGLAQQWHAPLREPFEIDLSPSALPAYTFFSLSRGLAAYALSLLFTLTYGYWAAKDAVAGRILVPLLDILQSIPVLSFLPGLVFALIRLFPSSRVGLELAAILMIFSAQAWNMTFSFYHSVRAVPADQQEAATVFRFSAWQRFKWVELPSSVVGLVWNSMMSMAGGWVFLMINESFRLDEDHDYRLPGVGSYMSRALEEHNTTAVLWALAAMAIMIVGLDQLLWRPVVVWAQKFRVEEGGQAEAATSWFLTALRRSRLVAGLSAAWRRLRESHTDPDPHPHSPRTPQECQDPPDVERSNKWEQLERWLSIGALSLVVLGLAAGGIWLLGLLAEVSAAVWADLLGAASVTLGRVVLSVAAATLWTLPAGLAIGLSPRWARLLQPLVQLVASFPAPLVFPLVIVGLRAIGVSLGWGSIVLILLGTQWYILFNVIAGATAVPADLREAARAYRITGWQRFRTLYAPALFPYLVTGWITAAGGAWNLSIVAEYDVTGASGAAPAWGLGAAISEAFAAHQYGTLAAATLVMSLLVVAFNRLVWQPCYRLAEQRFALNK